MESLDYLGMYFLIKDTKYLLLPCEINSYWVIEFIENDIVYGYNHLYGSTLIFKKKDIKILGDINEYFES